MLLMGVDVPLGYSLQPHSLLTEGSLAPCIMQQHQPYMYTYIMLGAVVGVVVHDV